MRATVDASVADCGEPLVAPGRHYRVRLAAKSRPSGNLAGGRTGVTIQLDTGHFGASTNPLIGRTFVESLAGGGTPSRTHRSIATSNAR